MARASGFTAATPSLLLLAAAVLAPTANAQQAPQVTPRDLRPVVPVQPQAPLPEPAPETVPPQAARLSATPAQIVVADGFPELATATEALVAPMRGQRATVAAFYALAEAIEALYRAADFPLVRVTLPPQSVADGGTLQLRVLDGFIERIDASAVPEKARATVDRTVQKLLGQRHLRGATLERVLGLASRGPGVTLRSALGAGQAAGGAVLVLEADFKPYAGSLGLDNKLSQALGHDQATLQLRANQPLGRGEQVYGYFSGGTDLAHLLASDARRRVGGAGVILPIGDDGLSLNLEVTRSVSQPRTALPFVNRSEFERTTLRLSYPLILEREQELTLTGTFDATSQRDSLPDFGFQLDHDRLRVARVGADWTRRTAWQGRVGTSLLLSKGTNSLGTRTREQAASSGLGFSRFGADPAFTKLEVAGSLDQPLPAGLLSRTVFRGQYADSVLPGAELFSLDGDEALSGFRTGALYDDRGRTLRQEVSRPFALGIAGADASLAPYVFAAIGKSGTRLAGPPLLGLGRSVGFGVRTAWRALSLSAEASQSTTLPYHTRENRLFLKAQVQF